MKMTGALWLMCCWALLAPAQQGQQPRPENRPAAHERKAPQDGDSCTRLGLMHWTFFSEGAQQPVVELLITDSKGRRLGQDVAGNKGYEEIPSSSYGVEGLDSDESSEEGEQTGVVEMCNPEPGDYKVQVFGKASGKYSIEVYATSKKFPGRNGLPESVQSSAMVDDVSIKKGAVQTLTVKYSREPGEKVEVAR
jgi:hypothetical protein